MKFMAFWPTQDSQRMTINQTANGAIQCQRWANVVMLSGLAGNRRCVFFVVLYGFACFGAFRRLSRLRVLSDLAYV